MSFMNSVMEPDFFAGAGENEPAPGCSSNSCNFSQIITIVAQIERKNRYTLKKVKLSSFILQNYTFHVN